ncbi:propanediol utilization phosphotransacylase [Caldalkalibacillus thermarum]|uniref:phosphate propanoyltransferase n=1 Tax=Caldalkalibacillus thermarum TaxID=296745 RepID=UPI001668EBF1|nr:phosphate propanoyltransferase [Caldalkalibacillus thermarum]GGK30329.1 propanediol utilization phosphotransacylase [Caldalkalibacillus thermarum]
MNKVNREALVEEITKLVIAELKHHHMLQDTALQGKQLAPYVPVSVSARHVHLQQEHVDILFGKGYQLTKDRDISQPGQYACQETVTLMGPGGKISNVRVLGPLRKQTQVEVARSDARVLGISPPVRHSGDLKGSAPIVIIGPKGTVRLKEGCIIADRHIHMTPQDAQAYGVYNSQKVSVLVEGEKGGIMNQVTIRVRDDYALDMHIDTDDANAFGLTGNEYVKIIL